MEKIYNKYVLGRNPQASVRQVPKIHYGMFEALLQDKTDEVSSPD